MKKRWMKLVLSTALVITSLGIQGSAFATKEMEKVIIVYKNQVDTTVVEKQGGQILEQYQYTPIVVAKIPVSKEKELRNEPTIESVELDLPKNEIAATTSSINVNYNWGASLIKATQSWDRGLTGKGVNVAVIDTGVDTTHPQLKVAAAINCITLCTTYDVEDHHGHGTHVSGIIAAQQNAYTGQGVAPDVNLYSIKVMDTEEVGGEAFAYTSDIVRAIEWSISHNIDIINLSLGSTEQDAALEAMLGAAYQKGILIVAASGNKKPGTADIPYYPAAYKESVISVGAVDEDSQRADFSVGGSTLEVVAPGVDVLSTYVTGEPKFAFLSGTSMATPYVVGALALYKEAYPKETNIQLRKRLDENALDLGVSKWDNSFGYGLAQAPQIPSSGGVIKTPEKKVITTLESYVLYKTAATSSKTKYTLTAGEYVYTESKSGWYKVSSKNGSYWIKPSLYSEGSIQKVSGKISTKSNMNLYDVPRLTGTPKAAIKPASMTYDMKWGNWYHVKTYLGYKWMEMPTALNDKIRITAKTTLYNTPFISSKTTISPSTVTVFEKVEDWYHIRTSKGDRWIKLSTPMLESAIVKKNVKLSLKTITNIYDYPVSGSKVRAKIKPTSLVSYESWQGWYHVRTYLGEKWIKL